MLGQEQDSVGGGFDADQSFKGMLSNVNLWDKVLTHREIEEMSTSCLLDEWNSGNVYKWRNFLRESQTRLVKQSTCERLETGNYKKHITSKWFYEYSIQNLRNFRYVL